MMAAGMLRRILLVLTVSAGLVTSAQDTNTPAATRSLSLRECINLALSRNLDLQIQQLSSDIARYNLSGSYAAYAPTFSMNARHDFVNQPADFDPQKFNPDFPYELQTDTLGSALLGKLPMGLSYDFSLAASEQNDRTDFSGSPEDARFYPFGIRSTNNYYSEARVTLQQHLLKDFWIDSDRQLILIRRKELRMSQEALRFQLMKTVLAVELSYYDLITAREQIRVQEKTLELRQQLVTETRRRVQVGDLPPLDMDQAETQLQNTLTALAAAREAYVAQQNALKNLITDSFQEWADLELRPTDLLLAMPADVNRSDSFRRALGGRPDLIEARLAVEKSGVVVKFRLNQLLPNLDLVGRYGGLAVDPGSGGSAVNEAFRFSHPEYYYGVVLSFPVGNLSARGDYHASKASRQIAELELKKAEQEVLVQVADYVNRVKSRYSQVTSTRQARTYAEGALAAEQKKLQNGLSTSFVVLQLQEILTNARTAELQAMADYNKVLAQLAFAEGTILEKNRLTVEVR